RSASRRLSALVSGTLAARQARTPAALIRRLESPERLVAVLVAGFLLVASVTAVPGLAGGGTGATEGAGLAPRLALGGDSGPAGDTGPFSPFDGVGADPGLGLDETASGMALGQESTESGPEVVGQFLDDGTLLKPVVVDATVEDGRSKLRNYRVRPGDTLTGIASRFGVSMMTIWWANKLTSKDDLKIGQTLVIPPVDGLVVTVEAGDTLASVAAAERVSPADIVEANALTDETLVLGQVLIIPGARGDPIPTPKPTRRPVVQVATVSRQPGSRTTTRPPAQYAGGAFAWPVSGGFISQYFHFGHPALDIAADHGTSIRAAAAGTVIFAGWMSNGGGFQVWIAHGSGLYTTYSHMSTVAVSSGEGVGRGTFIGRVGSTGWSTGPHLHLEVWRGYPWGGGHRVNPLGFL
ncbi:MAG TPA: M23 family metallopeptidase, partial [Patescibacteria group bacterium]|nr:M23 family metallopeptidase [Patescibacteria group bacterium]